MKIHEYQARDLLAKAGIPVPSATVVESPTPPPRPSSKTPHPVQVVKAQVFAGGRGKAGFVKLVKSADEAQRRRQVHAHQPHGLRPDRPRRHRGQQDPHRRRRRYRQRVLRLHHPRPQSRHPRRHRLRRGRRGNRRGRQNQTRSHHQGAHASPPWPASLRRPQGRPQDRLRRQTGLHRRANSSSISPSSTSTYDCIAGRDQSPRRHQRRAKFWPSTPKSSSTTTPCSAIPTSSP